MLSRHLCTLAIAIATVAGTAAATEVAFSPPAGAATTDRTIMIGRLTNGAVPVAGAPVHVVAWPSQNVLATQRVGQKLPLKTVQVTATADDGSYAVSPDFGMLGPDYTGPDGQVSLDVVTGGSTFALPAALPNTAAAADPQVATTERRESATMDLAAKTIRTTLTGRATRSGLTILDPSRSAARGDSAGDFAPYSCTEDLYKRFVGRDERFLNLFTTAAAPASITETTSSLHSIGVGLRAEGEAWQVSGSVTVSTADKGGLTRTWAGNRTVYNEVNAKQYVTVCFSSGAGFTLQGTTIRVGGFHDILTSSRGIAPSGYFHSCRIARGGDIFRKYKGDNVDFKIGVDVTVVHLDAQASFSHDTELVWRTEHRQQMCGSNTAWLHADNAAISPIAHDEPCSTPSLSAPPVDPDRPC